MKADSACCVAWPTEPAVQSAETQTERLAAVFKALGDPVRLRMVELIGATQELCVCEITPAFDLSSATISHHLKTLREAGVVDCERRGTFVYYWIEPAGRRILAVMAADLAGTP